MPLNKDRIRETEIAAVFQQGLQSVQSEILPMMEELDENERRAKIAHIFPPLAHIIESHTREDLETDLQSLSIALAVNAIMGKVSYSFIFRIAVIALYPSITGICISIKTKSNFP